MPPKDEATPVVTEADEFGDAFAELARTLTSPAEKQPDAKPATTAPESPAPAAVAAPVEKPAAASSPAAAGATGATGAAAPSQPAAAPAASAPAPETPAAGATGVAAATPPVAPAGGEVSDVAQLREQLAAKERELTELRAKPAAPAPAEAAKPEAPKADEKPIYTDDEKAFLAKYEEDWADTVGRGEALKRRAEYQMLCSHIFTEVQRVYGPAIQFYETRAVKDQYSEIKSLVADYDAVRAPVLAWVEQQPPGMKGAYTQVVQSGTPQDVAALIGTWRQVTGQAPKLTTVPGTPAAAAPAAPVAVPPEKAAAIAALKPVDTTRSAPAAGADPNDFSGAFKEFVAAIS